LIELDDKNNKSILSKKQRNSIQYVRGERKVLNFLIDTADKALSVLGMNKKDALKTINSWSNSENIIDYFKDVIVMRVLPELTVKQLMNRVTPIQIRN
jgi:hypothetical protein